LEPPVTKPGKTLLVLTVLTGGAWLVANPLGQFGVSGFGVTTFSKLPVPYFDLQVRGDGRLRLVSKSHRPGSDTLSWLLEVERPEVVVIALGWQAGVAEEAVPQALAGVKVVTARTGEALALYNALKQEGKRVAIHVHSTC
jgi:hypothetical protein